MIKTYLTPDDNTKTKEQYLQIFSGCQSLFEKKHKDYGSTWRVNRMKSLTDQLFIKIMRIRQLQESGKNLVGDSIESEYVALVNYSIVCLIQLTFYEVNGNDAAAASAKKKLLKGIDVDDLKSAFPDLTNTEEVLYKSLINDKHNMNFSDTTIHIWYTLMKLNVYTLMLKKNHDYGEAWRDMRNESLCDLIFIKILRIRQIEDNSYQTSVSEGVDANYMDIINYSIFVLINMGYTF